MLTISARARTGTKWCCVLTLVLSLKICSHSVNRAQPQSHHCKIVVKVLGDQGKTCPHRDPVPSLVLVYKVSTSSSIGHGQRAQILACVCSHSRVASLESRPGSMPRHQLWTMSNLQSWSCLLNPFNPLYSYTLIMSGYFCLAQFPFITWSYFEFSFRSV